MTQTRLNDSTIIYVHKEEILGIDEILNQIIKVATVKKNIFMIN